MKRIVVIGILLACLSGCASLAPKQVALNSTFNPQEVSWFNAKGTGSITGQALLRTRGGEARTCAGLPVTLEPQSTYATERISAIYGSTQHGFAPIIRQQTKFSSDDPRYAKTSKTTTCDAQGNFSFTELPAGQYYIIAPVVWEVGYSRQGGFLMQQETLSSGESQHVILTQ